MVTPTVDEKSFPHTPSPPTKQDSQAASNTLHLVDLADGHYTLCGLPLAEVLTGGYCEHLDGKIDDPQFERTIFARDGREAEACDVCLRRQPAVLISEDCR